jgi:hypothetical protein
VETYAVIEQRFAAWAQTQPPIQSVVVVGSQARRDPPADAWSDLDLIIFTTSLESFASQRDWLSAVGKVWTAALEYHRAGDAEWQVIYEGGLKVDYLIARVSDPGLTAAEYALQGRRFHNVFGRGVRVLFDKNGAPTEINVPHGNREPPTNAALAELVEQFWLDVTHIPKRLRRGELWRAKQSCDCLLKVSLLRMISNGTSRRRSQSAIHGTTVIFSNSGLTRPSCVHCPPRSPPTMRKASGRRCLRPWPCSAASRTKLPKPGITPHHLSQMKRLKHGAGRFTRNAEMFTMHQFST